MLMPRARLSADRDLRLCWTNYPLAVVPKGVYWYYMVSKSGGFHSIMHVYTLH